MISVGSRDGRKELSLRYGNIEGVSNMDLETETEIEEGEAYFLNNNNNNNDDDDDSTIDPDVALSYLDEKLQDVLGHFQKDFEGGVSAENLGAKFGGYGSFLPTYQRSPACPNPKTPPKFLANNASISPNHLLIEGGGHNPISTSTISQPTRHGPTSTNGPPRAPSMNGKMKQEVQMMSSSKFSDKQQPFANTCDPKSLKVRLKVGSDNLSTRKKAEIYSGLGLDVSPSSSLEATHVESDDFYHEESPTSILEMMTSFPVLGGLLLSPLPNDLLCLTEKDKREDSSCGSVHKQSQETTFKVNKSNSKLYGDTLSDNKPKSENIFASINGNNVKKKEIDIDTSCEELVSNALKLPLLSNTQKGAAFKSEPTLAAKEESLDPVLTHDDFRVEKHFKKEGFVGNANSDEKVTTFMKSDPDASKTGKNLDSGVVKPPKQKAALKATSHEKDGVKMMTSSSSGSKKKSKGSQSLENGFQNVDVSKISLKNDLSKNKNNNNHKLKVEDSKSNIGKVRETYKDFFGELDPELEDGDDVAFEEKDKSLEDRPKDYKITEKSSLENDVLSKERLYVEKGQKPSLLVNPVGPPTMGNGGPVSDATVTAVVNEDWVCCDKCEKWRLLPPGVNPGSLPGKWLCSMLDWLPGMNRCSISQEETTKAITTQFMGPPPAVHGFQPGGPQSGSMAVDPLHPDQRHQPFGQQIGVKKKHGTKDLPNEPKQERPPLSSNSTKKNHLSNKTRSLNGANQSSSVNEVEFQDSGQSAEQQRFKHKEKKKSGENYVDEGNNALQVKIGNKRETSQDYSRDSKKVKTDDNRGTRKERSSDQEGALFKPINTSISELPSKDHRKDDDRPKDSKFASKNSGINPINQNGKFEEIDGMKKRKSSEFDDTQIEETSETGQRKGKKPKLPESREEEKGKLLEASRREVVAHASLAATSSSSKVSGSHKTKTNNHETKGSPVESVSSSPLRILNTEKLASSRRNIELFDNNQDHVSPKKDWEDDRVNYRSTPLEKVETLPSLEFETLGAQSSFHQGHNGERRKTGKGSSSSRSKDKNRISKSDTEKINNTNETVDKSGRNRSQDKLSITPEKIEKGPALKKESSGRPVSIQDLKQNGPPIERENEKSSKKDVTGRGKPHSLPPSGKTQNETSRATQSLAGPQKENNLLDGNGDVAKAIKQKKITENGNGNVNQSVSVRHLTPSRQKGTPSPLRREPSSQAATAIKEAKALKHMADRLKNCGSNQESNSLYFQAAVKFLYGSCLLESSYNESGKHGDMIQSMGMYSSTAKLCEYVAHEYEKVKEMAAASLAYKLAEVAYLKVVYSSHTNASKDRQELQTALTGPTGESPSSSASDIDNLNNPGAVEKAALPKGVNDGGNHVIAAKNKPNFLRILNFAQDVNFAMEASRRSQSAYAACNSQPEHAHHKEIIKPALDYNFQDIEGLLQLVRLAMEAISSR